jgi:Tfp pilus assembly protein PilP
MPRSVVALALGGVFLLASWVNAPADPSPAGARLDLATLALLDQTAPVVADVNAQVERLRERLPVTTAVPAPSRDPFRFGRRPEPPPPALERAEASPELAPAPRLADPPQLLAILTSTDSGVTRAAVIAVADDVRTVHAGEVIGSWTVKAVTEDAVEFEEASTGRVVRVPLRAVAP